MRDILNITKNVLKLIFRKKSSILVFMLLPIMSIFISKYFNTTTQQDIKIGIYDEDKSTVSKDLAEYLINKENFKVFYIEKDYIDSKILNKAVDSVIVLDKGFEESIINGSLSKIDMVSIKGQEVTVWQENYINYYISDLLDISKSCSGNSEQFFKVYNDFKEQKLSIKNEKVSDITQSLGVSKQSIAFLLVFMLTGATISAGTIARDKSNRVFKRLMASPLKMYKYILGNFIANFIMNILQIVVILIAAKILKLDFHMSMAMIFITLGVFSLVSVALGMFIASISSSSAQVGQISNAIIVPTCMLSGCFWPIELMPSIMQKVALILPQTWVIKTVDSLQSGKVFTDVVPYILIILAFAVGLFLLSVINIKKDEQLGSYV
ncbi:ABC transporter permease [Clostridium gasigenes]|uniref:ABC-2 type transport system permease protein n=1 Tax=Clostridium gasigenes TaxID=94869 RepID=A0A1H0L886_9CLOT|nr:ABC transporter permease [Clostridium gasigenes]SDO64256.1 ABC-2 type transport system permease protein [Clostridium gasigenes]